MQLHPTSFAGQSTGYAATENIAAGQLLLMDTALFVTLRDDALDTHCALCAEPVRTGGSGQTHLGCQLCPWDRRYCSASCTELAGDLHSKSGECAMLSSIDVCTSGDGGDGDGEETSGADTLSLRQLVRLLCRTAAGGSPSLGDLWVKLTPNHSIDHTGNGKVCLSLPLLSICPQLLTL